MSDTKNPPSNGGGSQDSIDSLIAKFEDYCLCDEYHYGDHDGIKGNHDPSDGHMEFDEEKFKKQLLAWHNTQLKEESIAATFRMMTEYVDSCNDQSDETEGLAIVPSFKGFKKFLEAKLDDMQARYLKEEWHG